MSERRESDPARLVLDNYPFVHRIEARFSDMDVQRHLNNAAITTFYEDTRVNLNRLMYGDELVSGEAEFRLLVLETTVRYLSEAPYPGSYRIGAGVIRFGGSSYQYGLGLFLDDTCVGLSETVMVHVTDAGPTPIPPARRARMEKFAFPVTAA
ncbi:MAG TPA: thioesterase family protein [Yinghuangia sp.]|uniref:acyl-CoA thioesterase n=1 Tax=Yinghuangia sp. YIM S10712 TaxID=3436930 RepID=UPI002B7DEE7F|nr:thioesterase family protein [Yinghuangia sp.]